MRRAQHVRAGPGRPARQRRLRGLSSWYVWASLGLFPVAGQSLYLVNAPSFERVPRPTLEGSELVIESRRIGANRNPTVRPQYVQSVTFNEEPLERAWRPPANCTAAARLTGPGPGTRRRRGAPTTDRPRCLPPGSGYPTEFVAGLPADLSG